MADDQLKSELNSTHTEPLLPIEKKLIAWSLGLGITLLIILSIFTRLVPIG